MIEREDREHLTFASARGRALYSFNVRDFNKLHTTFLAEGITHAGIILASQSHYTTGEQLRRIFKLIHEVPAEEMIDRLEFLSTWA